MGRGVNGGKPVLDVFLAQWPTLIFLPAILVLVVVLVTVTRWWDRRDESRLAEKEARRAGTPARPTGDEVIASPPPKPGDRSRRPWRWWWWWWWWWRRHGRYPSFAVVGYHLPVRWAAPRFSDRVSIDVLCRFWPVQPIVVDFLRRAIPES